MKINIAALNRFEKTVRILRSMKKFLGPTGFGLFVALILELIIFTNLSPYFLNSTNFSNIGRAMVIIGIGSIGATIIIISGGFDLSAGSVMAASGMLAAFVINQGQSNLVGVVLALMLGCIIGLFNGFVIGYIRINPLIATLAMLSIVRGLAYIISGGNAEVVSNPAFLAIGTDSLLGIPLTVWIFVILFLSVGFVMPRTHFGKYVYAIGSNSRAARLAGILVNRWTLVFYAFSGTTAALAGYVTVARTGQAEPSSNIGAELDMITAVILGGASLSGGKGRLFGTFLAIVVLAILANGLVLIGVPSYWQLPVKGCVLMGAIIWGELHNASRDKS